jgi:hypothetical protein
MERKRRPAFGKQGPINDGADLFPVIMADPLAERGTDEAPGERGRLQGVSGVIG